MISDLPIIHYSRPCSLPVSAFVDPKDFHVILSQAETSGSPQTWLNFNIREYSCKTKKTYREAYNALKKQEIDRPEALNFANFRNVNNGRALRDIDEFCRVSFRHLDRSFTSQAWNMLFRIEEPVREYVFEFLYTVSFKDHVVELDVNDTLIFQIGARLVAKKAKGAQKKSRIVGAHLIGMSARYFGWMSGAALGRVTKGQDMELYDIVKLEDLRIIRFNRARLAEMVDEMLEDSGEESDDIEARRADDEDEGMPRRCPNMSFTNRLRVMDDRLGDIDDSIYGLREEVSSPKLCRCVNFMSGPQAFPRSSTTPLADPFGLFAQPQNMSSTSRQFANDMDEE
ncbi:hypothetical protein Tco_0691512 [Tanacetum coccineum]